MSQTERLLSAARRYKTPPPLLRPVNLDTKQTSEEHNSAGFLPKESRFAKTKYQRGTSTGVKLQPVSSQLLRSENLINLMSFSSSIRRSSLRKSNRLGQKNIEEELKDLGIDLTKPFGKEQWIPLELFDDKTLEDHHPREWISRGRAASGEDFKGIPAKGFYRGFDSKWREVYITDYDPKRGKFLGVWALNGGPAELSRLEVCFEEESTAKFAKRLQKAIKQRILADSIIRYNYYIDKMPIIDTNRLDKDQVSRIEARINKSYGLNIDKVSLSKLKAEVDREFSRAMNKFTLDKYLREEPDEMALDQKELPETWNKEVDVPDFGRIQLPKNEDSKDFRQARKEFLLNSLLMTKGSALILQNVRTECNLCLKLDLFDIDFLKALSLEDFRSRQDLMMFRCMNYLINTWVPKITEIIRNNQSDLSKELLEIEGTSKKTIQAIKYKKVITMSRQIMQATLRTLVKTRYEEFYAVLADTIPQNVVVKNMREVFNSSGNQESRAKADFKAKGLPCPPFTMSVIFHVQKKSFEYSTPLDFFVSNILDLFNKVLQEVGKVPDPEGVSASSNERKEKSESNQKNEKFLKVPHRPRLDNIVYPPTDKYKIVEDENKWVAVLYENLEKTLEKAIQPLKDYLVLFSKYKEVIDLKIEDYIKKIEKHEPPKTEEELVEQIRMFEKKAEEMTRDIPEEKEISCFKVNCKPAISSLTEKYKEIRQALVNCIDKRADKAADVLLTCYNEVEQGIKRVTADIVELVELEDFLDNLSPQIEKLEVDSQACGKIYTIVDQLDEQLSIENFGKKWEVLRGPDKIKRIIEERREELEEERARFKEEMLAKQIAFVKEVDNKERLIMKFHQYQRLEEHEEISKLAIHLNQILERFEGQAKVFNNHESLFGMPLTDYSHIAFLQKEFNPYLMLWTTLNEWNKNIKTWMGSKFEELDAESAEKWVEEKVKAINSAVKFFRDRNLQAITSIAEKVKGEIGDFEPQAPLMIALRKKGMMERHWKQVSEKVGFEVSPNGDDFTFKKILDIGLMKNVEEIVEIGERAEKEYAIEMKLNEMQETWDKTKFNLQSFKTTYIIKGFTELIQMLDEQIIISQGMQFSPFKEPFEDRINEWNEQLLFLSQTLEEWANCQNKYLYLQPIFESSDISKQLPMESRKFRGIESMWKSFMQVVKATRKVFKICSKGGPIDHLLDKLRTTCQELEAVQKELYHYLEKKREAFARFYFLSNDELLEILSKAKEPAAIQPYLKKVFENVHKVDLNEINVIQTMYSGEGETIDLLKGVECNSKQVETWMGEFEAAMKATVREALLKSVREYESKERNEWVMEHVGQCVLNGSQIHWTREVEEAIVQQSLREYCVKSNQQILNLVHMVRTRLSTLASITINALIVIDVHAKDVVEKLYKNGVTSVSAFEWISQLRYYWQGGNCYIKCIQTNFPYGYEYLGNTLRLVITPLTDKCYLTLMGALKLNLGGAPSGPAGTGKTETTKDLAKALAKQCVVFNCSEGMDYTFVAKFFKGVSMAGAWACFDEFNRINIEVLSVIAQQLLTLFGAKAQERNDVVFEGSTIRINPTFSVFITMNPGYAGRTELPDNLIALFRPVAMMVPDYALIGEIMLYSFGFGTARDLARKMVAVFRLSSEQLSSQDHYDYGMRAIRSVINAAGLLKRANPTMNEERLLLRAIRDVNVPKFLKDDLPLFENIISDLFPNEEIPLLEHKELLVGLHQACKNLNLQKTEAFIQKTIQIYDTTQVRHGLMLVGPTGGGKTSSYRALQQAMGLLERSNKEKFRKVHTHILNPKAITIDELYGCINEQTKEWTNGILASLVKDAVSDISGEKHWIIADGPVDALWVESLNTALDDNKKLCLNSGQIITLTPHITMMFEVEDLAAASPATVSRCGMIYIEPTSLGIQPLIDSWVDRIPENIKFKNTFIKKMKVLIDYYLKRSIDFIKKKCKEVISITPNAMTQNFLKLFECYFIYFKDNKRDKTSNIDTEDVISNLEHLFVFCLIWSVGSTTDSEGRKKFETFLRGAVSAQSPTVNLPESVIYDFNYDCKKKSFEHWTQTVAEFAIDSKLGYCDIIVPTIDNIRMSYLMKLLLQNNKHVLCPGPTGTGKTINAQILLQHELSDQHHQYVSINFSALTTAAQVRLAIDSKIEKKRRGYFGPPAGKKCVVFLDDLNMPKKELYQAQPPVELVRQYLDHQGWYDTKKLEYQVVEDLVLLGAMSLPGGGRSAITNRVVRHFNILAYKVLEEEVIRHIFSTILTHFFSHFPDCIRHMQKSIVDSVISVYNSIKSKLKPTPTKSFYTFNLRDISKVFQGICSAASTNSYKEPNDILKLWYHECLRVFQDRLTTHQDRDFVQNLLKSQLTSKFNDLEVDQTLFDGKILFVDFMKGRDGGGPREYVPIKDLTKLTHKIEDYLKEYNAEAKDGGQMKLIMFLDACEHVARICRILRQLRGHALLLGVGGSGRQSLAKLSAFVLAFRLFQIAIAKDYNLSRWRDDLKSRLMIAGVQNKPVGFLIVDSQIIFEEMLEDINSILNTGDVPNLYRFEDMEIIYNSCRTDCIQKGIEPSKTNIFSSYISRIHNNFHFIIAMSPLGENFRNRIRMFPSLVNCTTIDWFAEWSDEALINVGNRMMEGFGEEFGIVQIVPKLSLMFKNIHKSVEKASTRYFQELRRYNYVTPTSFLELVVIYQIILREKRQDLKDLTNRLQHGLQKLIEANNTVQTMEKELIDLQPQLDKAEEELNDLMKRLVEDKKEADQKQKMVTNDEFAASKSQQEALDLQIEAKEAVAEAQKVLDKTMENVRSLEQKHLDEIKAFKNPPEAVFWTIAGVCVMLGEKVPLKTIPSSLTGEKKEDYFDYAKRELLVNPREFMKRLLDFAYSDQKNCIPADRIIKFETKVKTEPAFQEEKVRSANVATKYLWGWVTAMYNYHQTYVSTNHLREKLAITEKLLAEKTLGLNIKKDELVQINDTIKDLEKQYDESVKENERLIAHKKECEIKLQRAKELTIGLSDEKERWARDISMLEKKLPLLPGDLMVAAGMIVYAGPFTWEYRNHLENSWAQDLDRIGIDHSEDTKMKVSLYDASKVYMWNMNELPKDDNSIENGIIIDKSRRWPLIIDPQNQANKFIKSFGSSTNERGLDVVKGTDISLFKVIENAIQKGKWVLVEDVGIQLDQSLDPLINQQTFKQAGEKMIKLRDKIFRYHEGFRLLMTTRLSNPHYSPETFVKLTIINFGITPKGLEDQMLNCIVTLEDSKLEQKKIKIFQDNADARKQLITIEDNILQSLSSSQGNILSDESLVDSLANSKKVSAEIVQRVNDSKLMEEQIDMKREIYRPVALRASTLFFCIDDLSHIDPMYQYSLQWFIRLFIISVENTPTSPNSDERLRDLNQYFTYLLYKHICRSLFEKHKLLFSLMLTVRILQERKQIDPTEWLFFLTGFTGDVKVPPSPCKWISETAWPSIYREIHGLSLLKKFSGFEAYFMSCHHNLEQLYNSSNCLEEHHIPEPWATRLSDFQKILIIKALRPDKVIPAIKIWISKHLGPSYLESPPFSLDDCYNDSDLTTPLVFILSTGFDPLADFLKFAEEKGFSKRYDQISLGQGQSLKAEKMIYENMEKGGWVLLQNCHLAVSWMPSLQKICNSLNPEVVHSDFRLWLTSMPTQHFPGAILQNGIKITLQPPIGLRANLLRLYNTIDDGELEDCKKPDIYKKLLFGFAMFHAVVLERRKFGPIGWNVPYKFTNEDLIVCQKQLKIFLDEYEEVPYKVLNYLAAEINYGGRVTDDRDIRLIKTTLNTYINPDALKPGYRYSESGIYYPLQTGSHSDYFNYIRSMPLDSKPEVFGLHENAEILAAEYDTRELLSTLLTIQPSSITQSGKPIEEEFMEIVDGLEKRIPPIFNYETIYQKYPTEYFETMNTVLLQEISRYNNLLAIIPPSLVNLKKALKGEIVMSEELELLAKSLLENQVPDLWKAKSFLSLKPLASWIEDLNKRVKFLESWIENGIPNVFWMSGFFFPQAFITGILQNCARKRKVAINNLYLEFKVLDDQDHNKLDQKPTDGAYIYGLFLEGASWNYQDHIIDNPLSKQLYAPLPLMWLRPTLEKQFQKRETYECPIYKVVSRAGSLSTTGHSTNFVVSAGLPSNESEEKWIKAGVAAFLSLRY